MTKVLKPIHIAAVAAIAAVTGGATIAIGQSSAEDAADAAEQVASEAEDAIRAIDPTTGGDSLVVDPSLPQPYGPTLEAGASAEPFEPGLPPLEDAETPAVTDVEPPRSPAARMISEPQVQTLPSPQPNTRVPAETRQAAKKASNDPFVVKSILPVAGTIKYGEWFWDESRAPKNGKLVITVDLEARVISAFRDGHEIGTAVALLGTRSHPTPIGTFPILTKEKDNVSEKYNNAPMPWTLRLTWDGIAIHGSPVINGYASHGCVGVPDPFAEKLFAAAKRGDKVVITRGKMIGIGDKIG